MDSFKGHSSFLEKQDVLRITNSRLIEASKKYAKAHGKLQECIKDIQKCMEEAKVLYLFCLQWPNTTKSLKDHINAMEM